MSTFILAKVITFVRYNWGEALFFLWNAFFLTWNIFFFLKWRAEYGLVWWLGLYVVLCGLLHLWFLHRSFSKLFGVLYLLGQLKKAEIDEIVMLEKRVANVRCMMCKSPNMKPHNFKTEKAFRASLQNPICQNCQDDWEVVNAADDSESQVHELGVDKK